MKPGDLVRRIVSPDFGLAVVLRKIDSQHWEILCADGEVKTVYHDALEVVDEAEL
jgi:hypothetical protein